MGFLGAVMPSERREYEQMASNGFQLLVFGGDILGHFPRPDRRMAKRIGRVLSGRPTAVFQDDLENITKRAKHHAKRAIWLMCGVSGFFQNERQMNAHMRAARRLMEAAEQYAKEITPMLEADSEVYPGRGRMPQPGQWCSQMGKSEY